MAIGRCVSACGATGTSRNDGSCGVEDRSARRQRVGGGAGRRGDDDAVGAQRIGEAAVDLDRAFDHAAERAAVDDDVVQREQRHVAVAFARDRHREQRAALLDVAAVEHRVERRLHARERDVGQEAQAALVDADRAARRTAPAGARSTASCRRRRARSRGPPGAGRSAVGAVGYPGTGAYCGGLGIDDDLVSARGKEPRQPGERRRDAGARVAADEGHAGEGGGGRRRGHGTD